MPHNLLISSFLLLCTLLSAQELDEEEGSFHQVQMGIGHTHLSNGIVESMERGLTLPSFMLNYNFHFDEKWLIGLHTDLIVSKFEVEQSGETKVFRRTNPVTLAAIGGYRIWGPLEVLTGGGVEVAPEETLGFWRVGLEASWPFAEDQWEVSVLATYELKFEAYNSVVYGLAISKIFGR